MHSDYSVLDSINKIDDIVGWAKSHKQKAIALTDHGTMGGLIEFHKACRKAKVKPILGCEFYHAEGTDNRHITVLARNYAGFKNMIKLNNIAVGNFYKRPRIESSDLKSHADGLVVLSGCISGKIGKSITSGSFDKILYYWMADLFPFYIETQYAGMKEQKTILDYVRKKKLKFVPTGDVHYPTRDHKKAQDVLYSIKSKKPLGEFVLSGDYSFEIEDKIPESEQERTLEVADLIEDYDIAYDEWQFPDVEYDEKKIYARLVDVCPKEYMDRLKYEWGVIKQNGFIPYFVLIADLCEHFDRKGQFRGWGRGSASGSLVSYLMGITKIDPVKWGLYFERFLNPERISPPDIDLDFTPKGRDEAIAYLCKRYGGFCRIGSYGTFGSKDVINVVSKVTDTVTGLASWVPNEAPVPTIKELIKTKAFSSRVKVEKNEELIDLCLKLEGVKKSESIHASGVVQSEVPLKSRSGVLSTAWDMYSLEDMKIMKLDVLGVENLAVIEDVCATIGRSVKNIPLDDEKTFALINEGRTLGMFQWESTGYVKVIKDIHPDNFNELVDLNTLYRPGCLESGMTEEYIERKHKRRPITQLHPKLKLRMGLILFQEDVMTLVREIAGFTLPEADTLRKAIGKKDKELLASMRDKFISGCKKEGFDGGSIWSKIEKYGRYTWNLSHAVAYTLISYWTAYFSANYPEVFLCELLNHADISKRTLLLNECRQRDIKIGYPDINASGRDYRVKNGVIYIGFGGIKYLGDKTVNKILEEQPYFGREDFIGRSGVNKRIVDVLDRIGLFGKEPALDDERELLGYYVKKRKIDAIWWGKYADIGEIIDVHKKTTKRGDPMGFLLVEMKDGVQSITVFPNMWSQYSFKAGDIGIFSVDDRGVLLRYVSDVKNFMVGLSCKMSIGKMGYNANIFHQGIPMGRVELDEQTLKNLESVGIEKIK